MDLKVSNPSGENIMVREYRKGNWSVEETMALIGAKKMDDQRRMKRVGESSERGKPAELRWKWVEDYCWKHGCLRSQNQCNDKWDNLMRDFKKVREYEKKVADDSKSYWRIDKNQRKDNNLPSNLLLQIYEALLDVVERKGQWASSPPAVGSGGAGTSNVLGGQPPRPLSIQMVRQQYPPISSQQGPPPRVPPQPSSSGPPSQPSPAVDSDSSGEYYYTHTDRESSPAKRRKRGDGDGDGDWNSWMMREVGSAISKSGRVIAEAIESCEEREERRHREVVGVHQRRLQIEESKAEMNRQGINGLVDAINNLANSILALANHKHQ